MVAVKINTGLGLRLQESTTIISRGVVSDQGNIHCQRAQKGLRHGVWLLGRDGKLTFATGVCLHRNSGSDSLAKG